MKYFYIERINTQDGSRNGFYIQEAANLEKVLSAFDEGESDCGLYAPRVAEITEAEYENFPYFLPKNWVYGTEFEYCQF